MLPYIAGARRNVRVFRGFLGDVWGLYFFGELFWVCRGLLRVVWVLYGVA